MKKAKKVLALFLAAVMLVCTTVAATVAYLTSQTEIVNNTFTVGNVVITLDEEDVDKDKVTADNNTDHNNGQQRDRANVYHLMPGKSYDKDPTVWVEANSENCYVYVKVVNNIAGIEATDATTIAQQMAAKGWKSLGVENVYYYEKVVEKSTEDQGLVVFENFKITGSITNTELAKYATTTDADDTNFIKVEAYAVQAEGFDTATAAWEAASATWKI
ncbi:MAG: hypothetical protein IJ410_01500 [Oscillospiraceae bacterium]|nr:hypothetical protein [Oscillospiraceae bacterium]